MAWLGARPQTCVSGHWFAVDDWAVRQRLTCPVCGSKSIRYLGDANVPIFALVVEDIWQMTSGDEDDLDFQELSVEDCLEIGMDLETPWDSLEALADQALSDVASSS